MDIVKTIEMKLYRKLYLGYFLLTCSNIGISYLMQQNGVYIGWNNSSSVTTKNILLYGMIGVAIIYSLYLQNQKTKLRSIKDFDVKKEFHEKYFKIRMTWYVISCFVSCVLFLLVGNWLFFYFGLFELFLLLIVFPNKFLFKKELEDDDIVFI